MKKELNGFTEIVFLDDISRTEFWPAKEFFYDMLRVIIKQSNGILVEDSLRKQLENNSEIINTLASVSWIDNYNLLSKNYKNILNQFITENTLIIGYEMTPSLIDYLSERKIFWIDFRISPIRFLPDLVIAIRSSINSLKKYMPLQSLSKDEVELEAIKLTAAFRHNENYKTSNKNKDQGVFIIGQTPSDASLIKNHEIIKLENYRAEIENIIKNKRVTYLAHPASNQDHIKNEMSFLKQINNKISIGNLPLYDAFCKQDNSIFLGISSGSLQEAMFFGKETVTLYQPVCEVLYRNETEKENAFWQIGFSDFLSTDFWKMIISGNDYHRKTSISKFKNNELRKLHNVWWGYSSLDLRNDNIFNRASLESENKIKQILSFCLKKPSPTTSENYNFPAGEYFWNDRIVKFSLNGKIYCNEHEDGEWYIGAPSEKNIIIIWKHGFWIDKAYSINNWQQLKCINNIGDTFIIKKV